MTTAIVDTRELQHIQMKVGQPRWQRVILLTLLAYEAAGCLLGGSLLIISPTGKYMDMPVDMMHGVFPR